MLRRLNLLLLFCFLVFFTVKAQVTTSGITGTIKGEKGAVLAGTTIKATHTPTGSVYSSTTNSSGVYSIQGMRIGGPYVIEITNVGYPNKVLNDVYLVLGESYIANEQLSSSATELSEVVVAATGRTTRLNRFKTGASTNVSVQQISTMPALSRSISDFTKLTPQSNGNSFAGRDGRYNNVQIDGANFNNGFGLSDDPLPGGGGVSIDAIEEIQVNIAPYDVRQGGFTGAGINAVTRSGTNTLRGSAYYFFSNEGLIGRKVKGEYLTGLQESSTKTYGFRLGGPIIKNKLFFFLNAEKITMTGPAAGATNYWVASEDGVADPDKNITRVKKSDLEAVKQHLIDKWGYDPGRYENYTNSQSEVKLLLARIDWNISNNHRLAIRFNSTKSDKPSLVNANSGPNPRTNFNSYPRVGQNSMAFESTMYSTVNSVKSFTLELNSKFSNKISNQFLVTYSKINTDRKANSPEFPFVDIGDGVGTGSSSFYQNYMSFGYELFSYNNSVINDNLNIFNNVSLTKGKHNFVFGGSFEMQKFGNSYQREGTSYYRYASVADFLTTGTPGEVAPIQFGLTYVYPGMDPYAKATYFLPALYAQDNISVTDRFNVTLGVRAELPTFKDDLIANPGIDSLDLLNQDGKVTQYGSAVWPKKRVILSPRVGFRWDVYGNRSLMIRGGTGIFAGRVPFVWLTNQPTNTGVIQNLIEPGSYSASASWIGDIRFNPDRLYWLNNTPASAQNVFIQSPKSGAPGTVALVDPNFKMPKVFRTSIGFDQKLGNSPFTLTADLLYSKDLQSVYQFGANRKEATAKMYDGRDYYANSAAYQYNNKIGGNSASILSNTSKGYSFNFTVGVSMAQKKGFYGSLFFSHTTAQSTTDNLGSNASSAWGATPIINNPNDIFLASAIDALPSRIVGTLSYTKEYLKHLATTVTLYYDGSTAGRYSYTYNGDVNGDAIAADLLYIPNDASEVNFVTANGFTPQQQVDAFNALIKNSKYLSSHKGKIAGRNAAVMPWNSRFDLKFIQDVFVNAGKTKNTLQFTATIINFSNFLNSDWGIRQQLINNANTPLSVVTKGINPTFKMNTTSINGQTVLPTSMYRDVTTFGTTWSVQLGVRYLFN